MAYKVSFYISGTVAVGETLTLENQDGGVNGTLLTELPITDDYAEFSITESARYTLEYQTQPQLVCKERYLPYADKVDHLSGSVNEVVLIDSAGTGIKSSSKTISTDGTLADNSDNKVSTQKAVKTYVDRYESTANGKGASLVGLEDAGGKFTAVNIEAALLELYTNLENMFYNINEDALGVAAFGVQSDTTIEILSPIVEDASNNALIGNYRFQWKIYDTATETPSFTNPTGEIVSTSSMITINKPENGNVLYSGGTAGYAYLYVRVRFENNSGETKWSDPIASETLTEPGSTLTDNGVVDVLAAGGTNATKVIRAIAALISDDTAVGRMLAANKQDFISGNGTPTNTNTIPEYTGQLYLDTAASPKKWYKAADTTDKSDFVPIS